MFAINRVALCWVRRADSRSDLIARRVLRRSSRAIERLARCVDEHDALIAEAGAVAQHVVRHSGWLNCFRTEGHPIPAG